MEASRPPQDTCDRIHRAIDRARLLDTAVRLVAVPSPTGKAGRAADCLAEILEADGFRVERPEAGHPAAPAVVARLKGAGSGRQGRTLQFNGHLDTVHLPFVPPRVEGDRLLGSGASDMKAGLAAAVEALRALRDTKALAAGTVLLTAHDLHEAPWGRGEQLDRMIEDGCAGDAVLIPEPLSNRLPIIGRGAATWKATIRRDGAPVHEVMRPAGEPSVIAAGAALAQELERLDERLAAKSDAMAGAESVFIGQLHSGEIYNQFPQTCWLEGTRRWLPGTSRADVERELRALVADVAGVRRVTIDVEFACIRDAFRLDPECDLVREFQQASESVSGRPLPLGPKPFVDDGNSFWSLAKTPAITHGPLAGGQHTVAEWVAIDDLVRVARVYALTAIRYCAADRPSPGSSAHAP